MLASKPLRRCICWIVLVLAVWPLAREGAGVPRVRAQEVTGKQEASGNASGATPSAERAAEVVDSDAESQGIRVFELARDGGIFMYPIYLLSLVAVGVIIERTFALRTRRVLPPALVADLGKLGDNPGGFDPKRAYRSCQANPSAAANVIRSMLLKVGRPHSEVETTVQQASEREANRLYGNVRWLNLCSTLAPLIGLLGTVQGMIIAFHRTTVMPIGANKAVELANGIYTALVTTFGGLCVAIPAAFAAHYFEGKIQALFLDLDEMLFNLLPQIERYEGRVRFQGESQIDAPPMPLPPGSIAAPPASLTPPAVSPPAVSPPAVSPPAVSITAPPPPPPG
jgi:biopolymer transport protein ExbB